MALPFGARLSALMTGFAQGQQQLQEREQALKQIQLREKMMKADLELRQLNAERAQQQFAQRMQLEQQREQRVGEQFEQQQGLRERMFEQGQEEFQANQQFRQKQLQSIDAMRQAQIQNMRQNQALQQQALQQEQAVTQMLGMPAEQFRQLPQKVRAVMLSGIQKGQIPTIESAMETVRLQSLNLLQEKAKYEAESEVAAQQGIKRSIFDPASGITDRTANQFLSRKALMDKVDQSIQNLAEAFPEGTDLKAILGENNFFRTVMDEAAARSQIEGLALDKKQKRALFDQMGLISEIRAMLNDVGNLSNFERQRGEALLGLGFQTVEDRILRLMGVRQTVQAMQELGLKNLPPNIITEPLLPGKPPAEVKRVTGKKRTGETAPSVPQVPDEWIIQE